MDTTNRVTKVSNNVYAGRATVTVIRREPKGYVDIDLSCPALASAGLPGQFVMLRSTSLNDPLLPRPFDIVSASPEAGTIRLIIKVVGKATALLEALRPGDSLDVTGPLGAAITDYDCSSLALLVRGCGAAAVLSFVTEAKKRNIVVHTVLSAASADRFILRRELEALSDSVVLVTDDGSAGEKALGSEVLKQMVGRQPVDRIYSCGGGPFYLADLRTLDARPGAPVWLFLESYMACGFGHCHGCAVKKTGGGYSLVCRDGPLFRLSEIEEPCPIYQ